MRKELLYYLRFKANIAILQVYAVEASSLSYLCEDIAAHNGYEDKITVLHGRAEDVDLPLGEKVFLMPSFIDLRNVMEQPSVFYVLF